MTCPVCMGDEETGQLLLPLSEKRCPYAGKPLGQTQGLVVNGSIGLSGPYARTVRREAKWLHDLFRMDNGQATARARPARQLRVKGRPERLAGRTYRASKVDPIRALRYE